MEAVNVTLTTPLVDLIIRTSTAYATDTSSIVTLSTGLQESDPTLTPTLPNKCLKDELSEPDFPRYACEGSVMTSWIAAVFLLSMIVFGVTKCLSSLGLRNALDLRLDGVSFPQRPEMFVLLCSSLPLVFTVITRPLFTPLSVEHDMFIRGWGLAQTRFFFDLFTRTASIYHLVYWAYRTPLIHLLWRMKLLIDFCVTEWKNRPKPEKQPKKVAPRQSVTLTSKNATKPSRRTGRTTEHGYGKKRRRSKSVRPNRPNGKTSTTASVTSSADQQQQQQQQTQQEDQQNTQQAHVIKAGAINVIAPQPLFTGQSNLMAPQAFGPLNGPVSPYGQTMMDFSNLNMYNPAMQLHSQPMVYGMGFDMPVLMGATGSSLMSSSFSQPNSLQPLGQPLGEPNVDLLPQSEPLTQPTKSIKINLPAIPPTRLFIRYCKRVIPACIYVISFCVTIPSILAFEEEPNEASFLATRCTTMCRSYFYYDLVVLVTIPTILITVVFYHAALARRQLNGGTKMTYRLRCYYVTFILLNIPMFVLMLTSIGFRLTAKPYRDIYGTGIIIAITAYHTNFALKSTVYTTGCNCICCPDTCIHRVTILDRCITFFTTPVAVKDKEALLEGIIIPVDPGKSAQSVKS